MKIFLLLSLLLFTPPAFADCGLYGKVASDQFALIPNAGPVIVIAEETGQVFITPVDRGNYTIELPCGEYRVGIISTRRFWFPTVRLDVQDSVHLDILGHRIGTNNGRK